MAGTRKKEKGKRGPAAGRLAALFPFSFFLFPWLFGGCRSCELVEAELRAQERQLRVTREALRQSQCLNEALVNELQAHKQNVASKIPPEKVAAFTSLREVVLGRQTGGYDDDGVAGDEALQVVLEPRDLEGHAVRAPGALEVSVLEVGPQGTKTPLCTWDVQAGQLGPMWRRGLLSTGYFVVLPWKTWPSSPKLRVVARFTLDDGVVFEADRDVTVRLPKTPVTRTSHHGGAARLLPPVPVRK